MAGHALGWTSTSVKRANRVCQRGGGKGDTVKCPVRLHKCKDRTKTRAKKKSRGQTRPLELGGNLLGGLCTGKW